MPRRIPALPKTVLTGLFRAARAIPSSGSARRQSIGRFAWASLLPFRVGWWRCRRRWGAAVAEDATIGKSYPAEEAAGFTTPQRIDDSGHLVAVFQRAELPSPALDDAGAAKLDRPVLDTASVRHVELDVHVRVGPLEG